MSCNYYPSFASVKQGNTWLFSFTWMTPSGPLQIHNSCATMSIRTRRTFDLIASITDDNIMIMPEQGKVLVTVPEIITKNIHPDTYLSDVKLVFADTGYTISSQTMQIPVEVNIT